MSDDFSLVSQPEEKASDDFASITAAPVEASSAPRPLAAAVASVATSPDTHVDTISALQKDTIDAANNLLQSQNEFGARLSVARQQQERTMRNINALKDRSSPLKTVLTPETMATIDQGYRDVAARRMEDEAKTSFETETVRRITDVAATGDLTEARMLRNIHERGNAEAVFSREATKNLILGQYIEKLEGETGDESIGGKIWNFATSLIPLNYNFSRAGVVAGGEGGLKNWLLSGTGLSSQGETFWNRYDDPKDMATALAPGGEADTLIRSNATSLGGFDPSVGAELAKALQGQSASDKAWADTWGAVEVGTLLPWGKAASIPKVLSRLGARSLSRAAVADAFETVVADSASAAARRTGVGAAEVEEHILPTAINPASSGEHVVPHGPDIETHLKAAEQALKDLPENIQATRATTPEEIQNAFEAGRKLEEKKLGHSVKDVEFGWQDVRSGEVKPYKLGDALPEQGNVVPTMTYTIGKKDGGLFANLKTAIKEARKRGLVDFETVENTVTKERKIADPDFSLVGYHGTADEFDKFSHEFAGKLTDAKSAKMAFFATDNPDVAWTYAVQAAKDRAVSLNEFQHLADARNSISNKIGDLKESFGLSRAASDDEVWNAAEAAGKKDEYNNVYINLKKDHWQAAVDYNEARQASSVTQQNIRPVRIRMKNPYIHDFADKLSNGYDEQAYSSIIEKAKADGHDGVILRNTDDTMGAHPDIANVFDDEERMAAFKSHDVYAVFNSEDIVSPFEAMTVKRDVSGGFAIKNRVHIKEDGFYTTPLNTPDQPFWAGLRSDARRLDRSAQVKAVAGSQNASKVFDVIRAGIKNSLKGLSKGEKKSLDEVLRKGQNMSKWLEDSEFATVYERSFGEAPRENVVNAYKSYRLFNDAEYLLRNDEVYKNLALSGHETVSLRIPGGNFEGSAVIKVDGPAPSERVFNVTDGLHYKSRSEIEDAWSRLKGEDYVILRTQEPVTMPDGVVTRNLMVKRGGFERRNLERVQLGYKEGGHRAYTGTHYAKQAVEGIQPDTGQKFLKNPNVFRTSTNPNRLKDWAKTFNEAIDLAKTGERDAGVFDDLFASADPHLSFPDGEEFLDALEKGQIDLKNPVEVVMDREMPLAYHTADESTARFVDEAETAATGYYRTTGRMYTSKKGEHLLDESGEFAETVDPWETMNSALFNASRMSSLSSYKANALERFKNTYGNLLAIRNLEDVSPADLLRAPIKDGIKDGALISRIKAEQAGISRALRFETAWEKKVRAGTAQFANWVLGDARGGIREHGKDFVYWLSKNNPVQALRSIAFDAKLGFFNVGQIFLQSSTMIASLSLHPEHGLKPMMSVIPLIVHNWTRGNGALLDVLTKRAWKVSGFASEAEMKEFHNFVSRTGFMNVGNNHLLINDFGPNRVFGAASMADGIREKGRVFFYTAEQMNRAVASRISWETLKKQGVEVGSAAFREKFIGLADDLTFNMTDESAAAFQKGPMSIPTQFWAYNVRMMDAMFGERFTTAQKLRLLTGQLMFAGLGGVPLADAVSDYVKRGNGEAPPIDSIFGTLDRGVIDRAIYETTGADVQFGSRVGTGAWLTDLGKDLFGMGDYGTKSPVEMGGGAAYSITTQWVPDVAKLGKTVLDDVFSYTAAESNSDNNFLMTRDALLGVADNVSSFSAAHKAWLVANYGMLKSSNGSVLASDLPTADAFGLALTLQPAELDNLTYVQSYFDQKQDIIKEGAKQMRDWRQEAFNNPDAMDENAAKAQTYMSLLPADVQNDVLKQTNSITDRSFYEHVMTKYQKQRAEEDALRSFNDGR